MAIPLPKANRRTHPDEQVTFAGPVPRTLRERDLNALRLKNEFKRITRRKERHARVRRAVKRVGRVVPVAAALAFFAGCCLYQASRVTGWPVVTVLKHAAAFPDCGMTWAVGLGPARRGEPGYYRRHDADNDGIACEIRPGISSVRWVLPTRL